MVKATAPRTAEGTWRDSGQNPHAVPGPFLGHHLGQADQAMLGGDVRRLQQRGLLGVDRALVDDAAAGALLAHLPQRRARRQERAVEVDREQPLPFREVELLQRRNDLIGAARGLAREGQSLCESATSRRRFKGHSLPPVGRRSPSAAPRVQAAGR